MSRKKDKEKDEKSKLWEFKIAPPPIKLYAHQQSQNDKKKRKNTEKDEEKKS